MFTDMVGFSALSQRNEALSLELLEEQRAIVRRSIAPHDGREVKTIGDGFLIEFPSALEAVNAAVEIQTAFHDRIGAVPAERTILLRIGIHVGDVVSRGGDIHGDGVNIASRIEPLALPGGICVSEDVERQVRNKLPCDFAALGPSELKNISLPVAVHHVLLPWEPASARKFSAATAKRFAWSWIALVAIGLLVLGGTLYFARPKKSEFGSTPPVSTPPATSQDAIDKNSIAVLAFANLSDDKSNEYFSDGVSEELLNVLSKVPGLKVSARTSAFHFKGKDTSIPEIARQLGVAYVVEGSVRKSGNEVRITAQLIKASDGFHVWSDTFTRELKNVFAVQDEIAGLIAKKLQLKIDPNSKLAIATAPANSEAVELYLKGRQAWNRRTTEGFAEAEDLFQHALAIDPGFARARAGLADTWLLRDSSGGRLGAFGQRNSPAFRKIFAEIDQALALDPNSAEAYTSLGNARWQNWQVPEALAALRQAIVLNPNYATAHQWLGRVLMSDGQYDESLRELARAAELDPLSSRILDNYSIGLLLQHRYAEALAADERALVVQPGSVQAASGRATELSMLGRNEEAVAQVHRLGLTDAFYAPYTVEVLVRAGLRDEADKLVNSIPDTPGSLKFVGLAALGRTDEALAAMRPDEITIGLSSELYSNPSFDPIRGDPRFVQLLTTLGLTEANARARVWHAAHPVAGGN